MLQQRQVQVAARGEVVTFAIGNVAWSLPFDLALRIAALMKYHARISKAIANCGRTSFSVAGVLTDLNAERPKRKRFDEELPAFLRERDIEVSHAGQMVSLRIGRHVASMAWTDANRIAKWLRLRGKQARNIANERAHWAQIARVSLEGIPQ